LLLCRSLQFCVLSFLLNDGPPHNPDISTLIPPQRATPSFSLATSEGLDFFPNPLFFFYLSWILSPNCTGNLTVLGHKDLSPVYVSFIVSLPIWLVVEAGPPSSFHGCWTFMYAGQKVILRFPLIPSIGFSGGPDLFTSPRESLFVLSHPGILHFSFGPQLYFRPPPPSSKSCASSPPSPHPLSTRKGLKLF